MLKTIQLKRGEDKRIRLGHPWIYSNEIDTKSTPLRSFTAGEEVLVLSFDKSPLGIGYVNPHSLISVRMVSRNPEDRITVDFLLTKLQQALALRERLFNVPYYRLVFSEADELPGMVVDRFGDHLVVQVNTAGMEQKREDLVKALLALLPATQSILFRNDSGIREQEGLTTYVEPAFGNPPETTTLVENDVQFTLPLWKGQKTGWFYDHRLTRARLKTYVKDKSCLDVFSYLGAFGIQAACFGASVVDCIDASATACDYILQNAKLNAVENKVNVILDDAFDAMKKLVQEGKSYEVIILDPPAFVKKSKDKKEGALAYQRINELALKLLAPGGILVSCSCSMHISLQDLTELLMRAAARTDHAVQVLERSHQGPDHPVHIAIPETDYLKAVIVRKVGG